MGQCGVYVNEEVTKCFLTPVAEMIKKLLAFIILYFSANMQNPVIFFPDNIPYNCHYSRCIKFLLLYKNKHYKSFFIYFNDKLKNYTGYFVDGLFW